MEKESRAEHSQVSLSLLVTNLTALKTFTLRSFIFIMFDYCNGRRLRSCLLFFSIPMGDYYSGMFLRCGGRKMAPSTSIRKKVLPLHVDMSRNKKEPSHIIDPFSHSPKTGVQWTFQIHILTHSSQSANIRKRLRLPQPRLLFSELISLRKLLITPNLLKKKGWGGTRAGQYHKVNQGLFFI